MGIDRSRTIDVPCPNCAHKIKRSLAWLEGDPQFVCENCGRTVQINAADFRKGLDQVDASVERLRQAIRKLNKGR